MTERERELQALLAEGAVYLAALLDAAKRLGLDMTAETQPYLDDVAAALKASGG